MSKLIINENRLVTDEVGKIMIMGNNEPTIVQSIDTLNTGWFSEIYPGADANGEFAEVALDMPIDIDFVSQPFTKAEISFTAEYFEIGTGRCLIYLAATQQVNIEINMGNWWVGNTATTGTYLGEYEANYSSGTTYTVDVTEVIRNNPNDAYFFAIRNISLINIRITNIQLSVYYD